MATGAPTIAVTTDSHEFKSDPILLDGLSADACDYGVQTWDPTLTVTFTIDNYKAGDTLAFTGTQDATYEAGTLTFVTTDIAADIDLVTFTTTATDGVDRTVSIKVENTGKFFTTPRSEDTEVFIAMDTSHDNVASITYNTIHTYDTSAPTTSPDDIHTYDSTNLSAVSLSGNDAHDAIFVSGNETGVVNSFVSRATYAGTVSADMHNRSEAFAVSIAADPTDTENVTFVSGGRAWFRDFNDNPGQKVSSNATVTTMDHLKGTTPIFYGLNDGFAYKVPTRLGISSTGTDISVSTTNGGARDATFSIKDMCAFRHSGSLHNVYAISADNRFAASTSSSNLIITPMPVDLDGHDLIKINVTGTEWNDIRIFILAQTGGNDSSKIIYADFDGASYQWHEMDISAYNTGGKALYDFAIIDKESLWACGSHGLFAGKFFMGTLESTTHQKTITVPDTSSSDGGGTTVVVAAEENEISPWIKAGLAAAVVGAGFLGFKHVTEKK